ncbi:hypothetical protein C8Q79DRAFT_139347 [Trametes meyenii]|nr:hypothetical protein C8Q79DRAFT_139347 [Trametes meyenii]
MPLGAEHARGQPFMQPPAGIPTFSAPLASTPGSVLPTDASGHFDFTFFATQDPPLFGSTSQTRNQIYTQESGFPQWDGGQPSFAPHLNPPPAGMGVPNPQGWRSPDSTLVPPSFPRDPVDPLLQGHPQYTPNEPEESSGHEDSPFPNSRILGAQFPEAWTLPGLFPANTFGGGWPS